MALDMDNQNLTAEDVNNAVRYVPMRRIDVELADMIIEMTSGLDPVVKGDGGWEAVERLIHVWSIKWPEQVKPFREQLDIYRAGASANKHGAVGDAGEIRAVVSLPERLVALIKAVFPEQKIDLKFSVEFAKRFKDFQIPEVL